jgi:hypothetical protein
MFRSKRTIFRRNIGNHYFNTGIYSLGINLLTNCHVGKRIVMMHTALVSSAWPFQTNLPPSFIQIFILGWFAVYCRGTNSELTPWYQYGRSVWFFIVEISIGVFLERAQTEPSNWGVAFFYVIVQDLILISSCHVSEKIFFKKYRSWVWGNAFYLTSVSNIKGNRALIATTI